jgi:hypothetical protein
MIARVQIVLPCHQEGERLDRQALAEFVRTAATQVRTHYLPAQSACAPVVLALGFFVSRARIFVS